MEYDYKKMYEARTEEVAKLKEKLHLQIVSKRFTVIKSESNEYNTNDMCTQMYYCQCGCTTLYDWDKFCSNCGTELRFQ